MSITEVVRDGHQIACSVTLGLGSLSTGASSVTPGRRIGCLDQVLEGLNHAFELLGELQDDFHRGSSIGLLGRARWYGLAQCDVALNERPVRGCLSVQNFLPQVEAVDSTNLLLLHSQIHTQL